MQCRSFAGLRQKVPYPLEGRVKVVTTGTVKYYSQENRKSQESTKTRRMQTRGQVSRDHACRVDNPSPSNLREKKKVRIVTPVWVEFSIAQPKDEAPYPGNGALQSRPVAPRTGTLCRP